MNKRFVTIALIAFGILATLILFFGLTRTDNTGQVGWKTIYNTWLGKTGTQIACTPQSSSQACATNNTQSSTSTPATNGNQPADGTHLVNPGSATPQSGNSISNNSPTAPTTPSTPAPKKTCSPGGVCTSAEVAAHKSKEDCWIIYGAKVYDVTNFVAGYSGATSLVLGTICGHDTTRNTIVNNLIKSDDSGTSILNSYWYANLS